MRLCSLPHEQRELQVQHMNDTESYNTLNHLLIHPARPLYASPSIHQPSLLPVFILCLFITLFTVALHPMHTLCMFIYSIQCTRTSSACVSRYCAGRRGQRDPWGVVVGTAELRGGLFQITAAAQSSGGKQNQSILVWMQDILYICFLFKMLAFQTLLQSLIFISMWRISSVWLLDLQNRLLFRLREKSQLQFITETSFNVCICFILAHSEQGHEQMEA